MKVHGTIRRGQNKEADEASVAVVEVDEALEVDGDERADEHARNPGVYRGGGGGVLPWPKAKPCGTGVPRGEGIGRSALNEGAIQRDARLI